MNPWLPTLLIWTLLLAGPVFLEQTLSNFSHGRQL